MRLPLEAVFFAAVVASVASAYWMLWPKPKDPAERERRRRNDIGRTGRMTEGYVTEVGDSALCYSYTVAGVEYTAAQDVSMLRDHIPDSVEALVGPVTVKFTPSNPVNSIIVCEEWSGFRTRPPQRYQKGA